MGYLLKEALKTLCGVNQWSYAIFWKIGCQNPKLLLWEECYYEPVIYTNIGNGVQATDKIHSLVTKMMKDNYINLLGEGLVGRVAFTRNHQWIVSDNKMLAVHPPEVSNEVYTQFSAGIHTIAVIPVHPHGVVQLGSSSTIIENLGFVNDVKSLICQLGCVPGALLSENFMKNDTSVGCNHSGTTCFSNLIEIPQVASGSTLSIGIPTKSHQQIGVSKETAFGLFSIKQDMLSGDCDNDAIMSNNAVCDEQTKPISDKENLKNELFQEESCLKAPSRDDLFDIVGMDFRNNNLFQNLNTNSSLVLDLQNADLFSVHEGESDSGIYSSTASDHLLEAVIQSSSKKIVDDSLSSMAKTRTSSGLVDYSSSVWSNPLVQGPKSLKNLYKPKEDVSDISSQISSCDDHVKRGDETSKSSRKRLKPGENPRPRPKDRQMIQDRVKELREIIPNGAKCSIDALLERTIKHMLFLQSVTKHSDKLKQTRESKITSKEGGLLLKDNFEGGATWAYEVDSQSMVCPIIVEDLNAPRQMLVEMVCEEGGSFLEIADVIKGLGLTILKGVIESRKDKIWAHFNVEANRDVTRMEIFISLVSLFDQNKNIEP